jgi:type VI secretion system secreted protein Hcp
MLRNRANAHTMTRVEVLEGRQLLATDTFIHIGTLTGAALVAYDKGQTPAADGWVEIDSFSWGVSKPVTGGSGTGNASVSSLNFLMQNAAFADTLLKDAASGKVIPEVEVVIKQTGANAKFSLEYDLSDVMVEDVEWSGGSGGSDTPTEAVSLAFGEVSIKYGTTTPESSGGDLGKGVDLEFASVKV